MQTMANSVDPGSSLIWVYIVFPGLSVRKLMIITMFACLEALQRSIAAMRAAAAAIYYEIPSDSDVIFVVDSHAGRFSRVF